MQQIQLTGFLIIVINFIVSYKGFKDEHFFYRYYFEVDEVLFKKDYKRIVTSGFLHVSWQHLIFNMLSLYFFSSSVEMLVGIPQFILLYMGSLIAGTVFALYMHRNHGNYSAVGASGAVSGVIFASVALFPGMHIGLFFLPMLSIPGWLYGLLYMLYTMYGIKTRRDNIGHDAHLGGGVAGILIALLLDTAAVIDNLFATLIVLVPALIFIYITIRRPQYLLIDNSFLKKKTPLSNYTIDEQFNIKRYRSEKDVNKILEKVHKHGVKSLTKKEKEILDKHSGYV